MGSSVICAGFSRVGCITPSPGLLSDSTAFGRSAGSFPKMLSSRIQTDDGNFPDLNVIF